MSSHVFGCPKCDQQFQVEASTTAQVVQCPSCAQTIEIPPTQSAPQPVADEPTVYACPACSGQFGVTRDMDGQQVACPHCQHPTLVQFGKQPDPEPEPEEFTPQIKTKVPVNRARKKKIRRRAKSIQRKTDLFAPGFMDDEPDETPVAKQAPPQKAKPVAKQQPPQKTKPVQSEPIQPKKRVPVQQQPVTPKRRVTQKPNADQAAQQPTEKVKKPKPRPASTAPATTQSAPVESQSEPAQPTQPPAQPVHAEIAEPPPIEPPPIQTSFAPVIADAQSEPPVSVEVTDDKRPSIAHLLPPTFDVEDPNRMRLSTGRDQFKVLLPDGKGGTAQVDNRVLRVKHKNQKVTLVALTDQQKARQRLIQNIVAILIGIIIMALAFTILM